jgi:hypothetical protein
MTEQWCHIYRKVASLTKSFLNTRRKRNLLSICYDTATLYDFLPLRAYISNQNYLPLTKSF